MTRWEAQNFSETAFKRLWWQGYSGRFIGLRWPTVSSDDYPAAVVLDEYLTQVIGISTLLPAAQFQVAEYQALRSGKGTALALLDLKQRYPDCARHLFSHSLGALVMAQAGNELKSLGGSNVLSSYVVCQGALDARAYDPAAPDLQRLHPTTTPVSRNYRGLAAGLSSACGRIVNFQNENDFALATGRAALNALLQPNGEVNWQFYQIAKKPRGETTVGATGLDYVGYEGDGGTNASYVVYSGGPPREYFVNRLAHPFESTAFAAKAESKAVGSGSGFGNLLSTSGEFDLGRPVSLGGRVGLNDARNAHSGQFNWHNYQVAAFYEELIRQTVRGGTP